VKKITKTLPMLKLSIKKLTPKLTAETELLLAKAISKDRVFILTHPEYQLSFWQYCRFIYYLFLFNRGYSIAAIIGHKEFFGLDFLVNYHVLIPRPETEKMVTETIQEINKKDKKILLLDIGTGTGCIPIAIEKNIDKKLKIIALDISKKALKIAGKNIFKHKSAIELIRSNLLEKIKDNDYSSFDEIIITANLPYLSDKQVKEEPSIQKEPLLALVAKDNGLELYKKLLKQINRIFTNKKLLILLEIDPYQNKSIEKIVTDSLPQAKLEIKKDLSGLDRIVKIST